MMMTEIESAFDDGMRDGQDENWFVSKRMMYSDNPVVEAYEIGYRYGELIRVLQDVEREEASR